MKNCFKCNTKKPLIEFYKHKAMADGHLNKCKVCAKSDANKHRSENLERVQAYDRDRPNKLDRIKRQCDYHKDGKGREVKKVSESNYRTNHPQKYKAHVCMGNAIRDGILLRPNCCEKCGTTCKPQGHHDDYSKPLIVRWLCVRCHNDFHNGVREIFRNLEHTGLKNPFDDE